MSTANGLNSANATGRGIESNMSSPHNREDAQQHMAADEFGTTNGQKFQSLSLRLKTAEPVSTDWCAVEDIFRNAVSCYLVVGFEMRLITLETLPLAQNR